MFKYKNVMLASFALYLLCIAIYLIYSCMTLPNEEKIVAIICCGILYAVPLAIFISGRLKRAMPYILVTFYVVTCFTMSMINSTALYLPMLFACAAVICGFFLSPKLCIWMLALSDIALLAVLAFFHPEGDRIFVSVYVALCLCYNLAGLGMIMFAYAVQKNIFRLRRKNRQLSLSAVRKNAFWEASAVKIHQRADKLSDICDLIMQRKDIPAPVSEKIIEIQDGGKELLLTLNDACDYARLENKSMLLNEQEYSFHRLLAELCRLCSDTCTNQNIMFVVDCAHDIPAGMYGDPKRITQIVMNLFGNAVKFTKMGSISLSFSSRATDYGVNLQISVTDTGIGINPKAAQKMFTVYSENNNAPSTHLGLGISKQLVTLMGGFIFAHKEVGGRSRFTVTIPQKVTNREPFAAVKNPDKICVLLYLALKYDPKSLKTRLDELGVNSRLCFSRAEFMMAKDEEDYTHVIVDRELYTFDKPIFDIISRGAQIFAVCAQGEENIPLPANVRRIMRPLHSAIFADIFNSDTDYRRIYAMREASRNIRENARKHIDKEWEVKE